MPSNIFISLSLSLSLSLSFCVCVCVLVCSVRLWLGPEWLLHEERGLPLPTGLPEASRHALQQLQGVRGGRGGHGPGEDLPPSLLCVHRLQVSLTRPEEERLLFLVLKDCVPSLCLSLSLSVFLRRAFPAGECVTFSGKDCFCQRCIRPVSPAPNDVSYPNSKSRNNSLSKGTINPVLLSILIINI